jgi:hypothetical protein
LKHSIPDSRSQASLGDDIDFRLERRLQVDQQAAEIEQAAAGFQVHEKINVAVGIALAARHRAKDANVSRPAPGRYAENLVAPCGLEFLHSHGISILPRIRP